MKVCIYFFGNLLKKFLDLTEATTQADIYSFGICALEVIFFKCFLVELIFKNAYFIIFKCIF